MRKNQTQAAKPNDDLFCDAFQASPIGIAVENLEGQPLFVNRALCSMLGFSEEEMLNKHCVDFSPPEDAEKDWSLFQQLRAGAIDHYQLDKRYFRRDGSLVWGRLSISLFNRGSSPLVVALVEDITERKQFERSLLWRLEFESLVSDLSTTFINLPGNEVDSNIEAGLARIGKFLEMSRITIFEFSPDRSDLVPAYAWRLAGVGEAPPSVNTRGLPWWRGQILSGQMALMSQLSDLPEEASAEKEYFRKRGVVSGASLPLKVSGEIMGAITFVSVTRQVTWTMDLVSQLRVVGDILCNALTRKRAEAAVRLSEEKFSKAFQESPLAVMITSARDHRYIDVNDAFERLTGWKRDEIIGRTPFDIRVLVDANQRISIVDKLQSGGKVRNLQVDFCTKNSEIRTALESAELIHIEGEPCVLVVATDITDRKRADEILSTLSQRLIDAQEQERASIARELHDDVNQRIALAVVSLDNLKHDSALSAEEVANGIEEVMSQLKGLGGDIQTLSHRMHSSRLDQLGLGRTAKSFCKEFSEQHKVKIDFELENVPENLLAATSLCLFRILQEALQNAAKHSGSRDFQVSLSGESDAIQLTVRDSGKGFDYQEELNSVGIGLASMRERLKLVNGELSIRTERNHGTTIVARVPLSPRAKSAAVGKA